MPVTSISDQKPLLTDQQYQKSDKTSTFAAILDKNTNAQTSTTKANQSPSAGNLVELGFITEKTPTVSNLLKNNAYFQDNYWNVIFSDLNRNKQYTHIMPGTKVLINPQSEELIWQDPPKKNVPAETVTNSTPPVEYYTKPTIEESSKPSEIVPVGVLSKKNPTVSHLMKNSGKIPGNFWNIVHNAINRGKSFTSLRHGTEVFWNSSTDEITFSSHQKSETVNAINMQQIKESKPQPIPLAKKQISKIYEEKQREGVNFSEKLADSIKPLMGRPYNEIDCYGLVVRGLISQGVNYQGKGGLRQSLENAAKFKGLPENAFLTGEGLIENTGTTLYSKTYLKISDSSKQAEEIFTDIQKNLETGLILSFSTTSRGHTGVVAKRDDLWTYINSGLMDNNVHEPTSGRKHKVGEEVLKEEIKNWCNLAHRRNEPLSVTMGRLDEEKLKRFSNIQLGTKTPQI